MRRCSRFSFFLARDAHGVEGIGAGKTHEKMHRTLRVDNSSDQVARGRKPRTPRLGAIHNVWLSQKR